MRYPRLVLLSILALAISLALSGCGGITIMRSNSADPTGAVPTVLAVAEQVNGVAPNRKQEVQFSEAMAPATINAQSFTVVDSSGKRMPGSVSYDPTFNIGSFLPSPALQTGAAYTATITTAAASADGMHLASPYTYTFTTRSYSDTSPISVNFVVPAPYATCVSATTAITITFDEAPDANTVNSKNIVVTGPGGAVIPVTMNINVTTTQVVLTPTSPLPSGTITVTVSNVGDLADKMMASPYTWSFSTACSGGEGATYFYDDVGVSATPGVPTPTIRGFQVNVSTANLTEVPGSPFIEAGEGPAPLIVFDKDFLYTETIDLTTLGGEPFPSSTQTVWVYRVDPASGTLTQVQTFTVHSGIGIFFEPTGHNAYQIEGSTFLMMTINPDGTLTETGSSFTLPGPLEWLAASPNGKLIYEGVETGTATGCGKGGCATHDVIWQIDRDPASGALTANHQVSGTDDLHLLNLEFDASGNYLLGMPYSQKQIAVESVNYSTGDLTPVPGSPFSSTLAPLGEATRTFGIDPSGKFVYALSFGETNFNGEYLSVFSLSQTTGVLTPVETFDMTPGDPVSLVVDQSVVFVINANSINVFKRDSITGTLSPGESPIMMPFQNGGAAVVHFP